MLFFVPRRLLPLTAFLVATFPLSGFAAENLGVLGSSPKWKVLEKYNETITRDEFANLIQNVYCTHGMPEGLIFIEEKSARILIDRQENKFFTLRFAADENSKAPVPRLWRPARSLPPAKPAKPLAGLHIALDPGHLGGPWAKMEERWFRVGQTPPVQEGDLTLHVARMLAPRLKALGARVSFIRKDTEPVTPMRPDDFKELAQKILVKNGIPQPRTEFLNADDPERNTPFGGRVKFCFIASAKFGDGRCW